MRQLLGPLPDAGASIFFTVLFTAFFVGLLWFVYQRSRRSIYRHIERLPLSEE